VSSAERPELIVFLGNVGLQYARTRHNAGWIVADSFLPGAQSGWQKKFNAVWIRARRHDATFVALKPQLMMNRSGESVQAAARFFRVSVSQIAVVHDDSELPFGSIGIRRGGGLGGHNGLRSTEQHVGSRDFWRLRFGIGRPAHDLRSHVLGRFEPEEEARLGQIVDLACSLLDRGIEIGFDALPARSEAF